MLPPPTLSFLLPSLHDEARLACRIYHPALLEEAGHGHVIQPWRRNAAVVAHPYAMMGGSYDDRIVSLIAGTLLHAGYVVATFNFRYVVHRMRIVNHKTLTVRPTDRGAAPSGGHTSWTSKAEQADYMSVVGFLAHYIHYLKPPQQSDKENDRPFAAQPRMLMAGYSYGAMVTLKVPTLETILVSFGSPLIHTAAADIRLRAQHLAEQQSTILSTPASPRKSLGMRVGGVDDDLPRKSHDKPHRAHSIDREDRIRKGVHELLERTKLIHHHHHHSKKHDAENKSTNPHEAHVEKSMQVVEDMTAFNCAYLVVSPPHGLMSNLATMTLPNPFAGWPSRKSRQPHKSVSDDANQAQTAVSESAGDAGDAKLVQNPTLAVYGDADAFLALRKIRDWAAKLDSTPDSAFHYLEVAGAGHFWVEDDSFYRLRDAVEEFAGGLS